MTRKKTHITITDQFCGAGGSSIGATQAGAELKLALNHWRLAIETHNTNFPKADHDCTDISACDPRRYPSTDILITSPECTNHSLAKGKQRKYQTQMEMFGKVVIDPAEERSRATMWDVPRFAEFHRYNFVIVENVVDARLWAMWPAWLHAMDLLGYDHECVYMNSMHAHPTPQSRDRMYIVFWRKGNKRPNLAITPRAFCPKCQHDVDAVQSWKNGRTWGRYRKQYVYCCPACATVVEPYYYAAYNAIDWSLPAQRIGDRERPLKDATLRRVKIGLEKFGAAPYLVVLKNSRQADGKTNRPLGIHEPLSTQVASASQHWLVTPFIVEQHHNSTAHAITDPLATLVASTTHHAVVTAPAPFLIETAFSQSMSDRSYGVTDAMHTQTGKQSQALIVPPFLTSYYGTDTGSPISEAVPTMTTMDRHALVVPPFILGSYTRVSGIQAALSSMDDALPTLPGRAMHYVVQPPPFIVNEQANNSPTAITDALPTMLTGNHRYLVQPADLPSVEDCGFRMLEPHECGRAMAFPDTYVVLGNKRQRVKQYGNAVTPPAMEFLMSRCIATLR